MDSESIDENTPIMSAEYLPVVEGMQNIETPPYAAPMQTVEATQYIEQKHNGPKLIVEDFKENKDMKNAQIIITILLTIELVFAVYFLIQQSITLGRYDRLPNLFHFGQITNALVTDIFIPIFSVIYLIIFIVVVLKSRRIGILVFAWLSILVAIMFFVAFVLSCTVIANLNQHYLGRITTVGVASMTIILTISLLTCILTVVVIIYAFKLAKLLKQQEAYQYV